MKQKVYLVDGSGYIFRAFYAVAPLSTKDGFPTNALFGYVRMLLKLLQQADSQHVVVVFDAGRKTFRNDLYAEYKANRTECPSELLQQMPYFREISRALGLRLMELPGYEADDIIGTLVKRLDGPEVEVVIVSGDKDLMQLVNERVSVWDTMRDVRYGPNEVKTKFGVGPEQVVEILALTGDSSDNIPGLTGVGPKTATQLVEKYGDIEKIIQSAQDIKNDPTIRNRQKIAQTIELEGEQLRLSRKLVEIMCQAPVRLDPNNQVTTDGDLVTDISTEQIVAALERRPPDAKALLGLAEKFEFTSIFKNLNLKKVSADAPTEPGVTYRTVYSDNFQEFVSALKSQAEFAFDLETTSLDVLSASLVGFSCCWQNSEAWYVPLGHRECPEGKRQIELEDFFTNLKPILESPSFKKTGQNLKYDISVLGQHGCEVRGAAFDTMVASYLLSPDKNAHDLTTLARLYLDKDTIEYTDVVGELENFSWVNIGTATRYACQDAHYAWLLQQKLAPLLAAKELEKVFNEIEMPLVPILSHLERVGIRLDTAALSKMSEEFRAALELTEGELYQAAGCQFNINSPKQLADVLFNKLGISTKGLKRTKTGVSTDSSVLERLSSQHPLPKYILHYRFLHKLKSTYIDALPAQVSPVDGRLHSRFNQTVTGTGRLSSSDPNLQNIPIQTPEGLRIRAAFVAEPGNLLVSADYSQIELRLLAHLSGDENLIGTFQQGIDIHSQTAREVMGLRKDESVSPELRRIGKTINFGIVYGMSGFRLARELGLPVGVANEYIENYFSRYPKVRIYFDSLEKLALEQGCVSTLFGRKRFMADIDAAGRDRGFVIRAALNAPIQGTAADLIKLAMIQIDASLKQRADLGKLVLQIHDELVFEVPELKRADVVELIRTKMEKVVELAVPLKVDVGWGLNWQEAHG